VDQGPPLPPRTSFALSPPVPVGARVVLARGIALDLLPGLAVVLLGAQLTVTVPEQVSCILALGAIVRVPAPTRRSAQRKKKSQRKKTSQSARGARGDLPFLERLIRERLARADPVRLLPARQAESWRHRLLLLPRQLCLRFLHRLQRAGRSEPRAIYFPLGRGRATC